MPRGPRLVEYCPSFDVRPAVARRSLDPAPDIPAGDPGLLWRSVFAEGMPLPKAALAVPGLLHHAADPATPGRAGLLHLAGRAARPEPHARDTRGTLLRDRPDLRYDATGNIGNWTCAAARGAIAARSGVLLALLGDADPDVRCAAAYALAAADPYDAEVAAALRADPEPGPVLAAAEYDLRHGRGARALAWVEGLRGDHGVRLAAAVAWLALTDAAPPAAVLAPLAAPGAAEVLAGLPWFQHLRTGPALDGWLAGFAGSRTDDDAEPIVDVLTDADLCGPVVWLARDPRRVCDVPWERFGAAADLPEMLARADAETLRERLCPGGEVFAAAALAVAVLVGRAGMLGLVADIARGGRYGPGGRAELLHIGPAGMLYDPAGRVMNWTIAAARIGIAARARPLLAFLGDDDPRVRRAAAYVAGAADPCEPAVAAALLARLRVEDDPAVQVSLVLAAAELRAPVGDLWRDPDRGDALRLASAIAWLGLTGEAPPAGLPECLTRGAGVLADVPWTAHLDWPGEREAWLAGLLRPQAWAAWCAANLP